MKRILESTSVDLLAGNKQPEYFRKKIKETDYTVSERDYTLFFFFLFFF